MSFRKLQTVISQTTDFHFANYRFSFRKLQILISLRFVSFRFVSMFSCYFLRIIRQSIQVLCPVFSRKVFFRGVEGSNKVWTSKTSLSVSRQDFVEHGGRVISAAKQPEILHVPLVATNDLLSESPNSIFGTSFFLRETMNSLPGTNKLAFTESGISLKTNRTPVTQGVIS